MHFDFEAEHIGVKRDRRIDIVYDVTNTDLAHIFTSETDSNIANADRSLSKLYIPSLTKEKITEPIFLGNELSNKIRSLRDGSICFLRKFCSGKVMPKWRISHLISVAYRGYQNRDSSCRVNSICQKPTRLQQVSGEGP